MSSKDSRSTHVLGASSNHLKDEEERWYVDSQIPAAATLVSLPEAAEVAPSPVEVPEVASDKEKDSRKRSKTIARKQMLRDRRRMMSQGTLPEILDYSRPGSRTECRSGVRPCLFVSCRYHLYLDVNPVTGSIKINFPEKEVWELENTCALDVAEKGGITLEEVGDIMNLTRERIRQVEVSGLDKIRGGEDELSVFLDGQSIPAVSHPALPIVE